MRFGPGGEGRVITRGPQESSIRLGTGKLRSKGSENTLLLEGTRLEEVGETSVWVQADRPPGRGGRTAAQKRLSGQRTLDAEAERAPGRSPQNTVPESRGTAVGGSPTAQSEGPRPSAPDTAAQEIEAKHLELERRQTGFPESGPNSSKRSRAQPRLAQLASDTKKEKILKDKKQKHYRDLLRQEPGCLYGGWSCRASFPVTDLRGHCPLLFAP